MIVDPGLRLWGSERALAATLPALAEVWPEVILVTPPGAELAAAVAADPAAHGPVRLVAAPIGNLHRRGVMARLGAGAALAALVARHRPARLYLNQAGLARLLRPVAQLAGLPLVVHVRLREDAARVAVLRGTPRAPLHVIHVSESLAAEAGAPAGADSTTTAYDPYPPDPPPPPLPAVAPLVAVGRLAQGKGQHLLIEALRSAPLAGTQADLFGAGVAGDDYALRLAAQARGLPVRLLGFRADVHACLPAYRFLVSTSDYEPLGRTVMEAWHAGLVPIVYGGSGGAAEMVAKSGAGLVYDRWDAEALAQALRQALALPEGEHRRLVAAGRAWMVANLDLAGYRAALRGVLF
jgi:glycosyltransferase involved in cell wall biosynthesis